MKWVCVLHYADRRIEVMPDTHSARRVLESQPSGSVRAWMVWQNDLGIGQPLTPGRTRQIALQSTASVPPPW